MIQCDRCGGNTKEKVITSKKPATRGNQYTVLECLSGCKSGRYSYTFFPPRENREGKSQPQRQQNTNGNSAPAGEATKLLRSIDTSLKNILTILQKKTGVIPIQDSELQPDEDILLG